MFRFNNRIIVFLFLAGMVFSCGVSDNKTETENEMDIEAVVQSYYDQDEAIFYIDLENISFQKITELLLQAVGTYDEHAEMVRLEIVINIETGIRDMKTTFINDRLFIRYTGEIEDNKLILVESHANFITPVISPEDIIIDFDDLMDIIVRIRKEEFNGEMDGFELSRISLFNREGTPTYMLNFVNLKNKNQNISLYINSMDGNFFYYDKFGF